MVACSLIRSLMAVMTAVACSSLSMDHEFLCSGERTITSWMPPAVAWVKTGPRLVTTNGALPSKAG